MTFGVRLKNLRTKKGYTQKQVADILKVGRPTIAGYETKSIYPDYEKLVVLADLFECSIDFLLGRTDTPTFLSITQIHLIECILSQLKSDNLLSSTTTVTLEEFTSICEELQTSIIAIKLLQRLNKSTK